MGEFADEQTPMVIVFNNNSFVSVATRSSQQISELNQWGNSPVTAVLSEENIDIIIDYDGERYVIPNGGPDPIIPELPNYQP